MQIAQRKRYSNHDLCLDLRVPEDERSGGFLETPRADRLLAGRLRPFSRLNLVRCEKRWTEDYPCEAMPQNSQRRRAYRRVIREGKTMDALDVLVRIWLAILAVAALVCVIIFLLALW